MGQTDLPKIWVNDQAEKPDAKNLNNNASFLNMQQFQTLRNGNFEGIFSAGLPDFWTLTGAGAASAQDADSREGANAVLVTFGAATAILEQSSAEFKFYQGRRVKAWAFVKASVAAQARIVVRDGVGSTASVFHTGSGNYELLVVEHVMAAGATELTLELHNEASGTGVLFDLATLVDFESILGRLLNPADIATPTKEFFVPPPAPTSGGLGSYASENIASAGDERFSFHVPNDFTAIVSAVVIAVPEDTAGPQTVDISSDYAADGEDATAAGEGPISLTPSYVANQMTEFDVSGVLTGIAAGDYVGVDFNRIGNGFGNMDIIGFRMRYT